MDTLFALRLEHRLAKAFDFNITSIFSFDSTKITEEQIFTHEGTDISLYHECGTAACILGHARLELNDESISIEDLYNLLDTPIHVWPQYSWFKQALCFIGEEYTEEYWGMQINSISGQQAADLLRHIRLHQVMPESFNQVEKFYSACEVHQPIGKIIWSANALNITGYGSTQEQAILDYVEQLIYKDTGIRQNVS